MYFLYFKYCIEIFKFIFFCYNIPKIIELLIEFITLYIHYVFKILISKNKNSSKKIQELNFDLNINESRYLFSVFKVFD